jgi:hypothetical protein
MLLLVAIPAALGILAFFLCARMAGWSAALIAMMTAAGAAALMLFTAWLYSAPGLDLPLLDHHSGQSSPPPDRR